MLFAYLINPKGNGLAGMVASLLDWGSIIFISYVSLNFHRLNYLLYRFELSYLRTYVSFTELSYYKKDIQSGPTE